MTVTLNGQKHTTHGTPTVRELLISLGFEDRPVVVEINRQALLPREHATTPVNEGDIIEVVQITAGG